MTTELRHHAHVHKIHKFTRLFTGWLFPLNHQLLSLLKEKVLKGDAGDIILQVSRNKDCRMSDYWNVSEIIVFCEQNHHLFREMRSNMTDMEKRSKIHTFCDQKVLRQNMNVVLLKRRLQKIDCPSKIQLPMIGSSSGFFFSSSGLPHPN